MAYRTLKGNKGVDFSRPITEVPPETNVRLTITGVVITTDKLKLTIENDFSEKIYDTVRIDGPRFRFFMAALFEVDEMKQVIELKQYARLNGRKFIADLYREKGHDIVYSPRNQSVVVLNPEGNKVHECPTHREAYSYIKENGLSLTRIKLTNHKTIKSEVNSVLPKDKRF